MTRALLSLTALVVSACCTADEVGLRVVFENGLGEPVRFGCDDDDRVVQPGGRDRTTLVDRTGRRTVVLCDANGAPIGELAYDITGLPTCDRGRDLEVVLQAVRVEGALQWRLPYGEDVALVSPAPSASADTDDMPSPSRLDSDTDAGPVDTDADDG